MIWIDVDWLLLLHWCLHHRLLHHRRLALEIDWNLVENLVQRDACSEHLSIKRLVRDADLRLVVTQVEALWLDLLRSHDLWHLVLRLVLILVENLHLLLALHLFQVG